MCTATRPCPQLAFADLAALTRALVDSPTWTGRRVLVSSLAGEGGAKTVGRVVRYASTAPACAVPHELAHVLTWPNVEHDRAWSVEYRWLHAEACAVWAGMVNG